MTIKPLLLGISFLFVLNGIGCDLVTENEEWIRNAQVGLSHSISKVILSQLQSIPLVGKTDEELRFPIISPGPDPLVFPGINLCGFSLPIDAIGYALYGDLNILESEVTGLSKLTDDLTTSLFTLRPPFTVNYTLNLPSVTLKGPFDMDGILDQQGEESVLFGDGILTMSIEDLFFRFSASGRAIGKLELTGLDVDLGFSAVKWSFDGLTADGDPWDMSPLASLIKIVFNAIWTEQSRPIINEAVRCSLNHTVHNCNLLSFLLPQNDCLTLEPSPDCGMPSPTAEFDEFFELMGIVPGTEICNATEPPTESTMEPTPSTTEQVLPTQGSSDSSNLKIPLILLLTVALFILQLM